MSLTIELKELTGELSPGELLVLKTIQTQNKRFYNKMVEVYTSYISTALLSLQKKMYIKLMGEEFEQFVLRDKALKLFQVDNETTFEEFWDKYHQITKLPKTDLQAAKIKWKRLTKGEKKLALENISNFYNSLTNKLYCSKARSYLEGRLFLNEFKVQTINTVTAR